MQCSGLGFCSHTGQASFPVCDHAQQSKYTHLSFKFVLKWRVQCGTIQRRFINTSSWWAGLVEKTARVYQCVGGVREGNVDFTE